MAKTKASGASASAPVIRGVFADLATPRRAESTEADAAVFLDYLDQVARAGAEGSRVDGLVLFGSTGEFIHFDLAERMRAAGLAIRRSRVPVLIGVSHSTLEGALELAEHATSIGAAGVLLMPPYFYAYPEDQIFHFYTHFADGLSGQTPIYLHNSPLSANPMSMELMGRLLNTGRFAGILDEHDGRKPSLAFSWPLLASDEAFVTDLTAATIVVSRISAAVPELPVSLHRALLAGDTERVEDLRRDFHELRAWLAAFPSIVGLKRAAIARGWMNVRFAVPPDPAMDDRLEEFEGWFRRWLPGILSKCAKKG